MLQGGEKPEYIARRILRFASEDVGLADPQAISIGVFFCFLFCFHVQTVDENGGKSELFAILCSYFFLNRSGLFSSLPHVGHA